jgi:hypothetical protein
LFLASTLPKDPMYDFITGTAFITTCCTSENLGTAALLLDGQVHIACRGQYSRDNSIQNATVCKHQLLMPGYPLKKVAFSSLFFMKTRGPRRFRIALSKCPWYWRLRENRVIP